jgi:hypothetical protein
MGSGQPRLIIAFALFFAALPLLAGGRGENTSTAMPVEQPVKQISERNVEGGFSSEALDSPHVQKALIFLESQLGDEVEIIRIVSAQMQVVAGYKLKLVIETGHDGLMQNKEAVVYLPPDDVPQLVSLQDISKQ